MGVIQGWKTPFLSRGEGVASNSPSYDKESHMTQFKSLDHRPQRFTVTIRP